MPKAIWGHLTPFTKILILILMVLISTLVFSVVGFLVALPFFSDPNWISQPGGIMSLGMVKFFQFTQSIAMFIVPALLAGKFFWGSSLRGIGFSSARLPLLLLSALIIVACQPLAGYLGVWNSELQLPEVFSGMESWMLRAEENAGDLIFRILDTREPLQIGINILIVAVLAAFGEEMLFRGVLQPLVGEWLKNRHAAVWITAFVFAAIHLQFFTFLPRFVLGLLMGYLMVWGRSLWYPVAGHFTNNMMALVVFYYYRNNYPEINPLEPSAGELSPWWLAAGTMALIALLIAFHRLPDYRSEKTG